MRVALLVMGVVNLALVGMVAAQNHRLAEAVQARPAVEREVRLLRVDRPMLDAPVVALVGGRTHRDPARARRWLELQHDHVAMSSAGEVVVVERSGHFIPIEAPGAVAGAVARVLG
jgi:pimeloyl-ACP methyl ester carboxylesterase